jgi:hypothetical protein
MMIGLATHDHGDGLRECGVVIESVGMGMMRLIS